MTSLAGYAGGTKVDRAETGPLVCYHNMQGVADYGDLGHAEVVGMSIPEWSYGDFARQYFSLMDLNGDRPDKGDRGAEYRSLIGLPGGVDSSLFATLEEAAGDLVSLTAG